MNLSPESIRQVLISVLVLLISVALHEFGHAFMADRLGDDTPRRQGRVTLNPLAHADPIGTLLLPLIGGLYHAAGGYGGGFGWGKPVQWNPAQVRRTISMSTAKILVSIAGPAMNVLLAVVVACAHAGLIYGHVIGGDSQLNLILLGAVATNFILFFFNLLPLPPLDGGHIAQSFMPYRYRAAFDNFARYAPFGLLAIMMVPQVQVIFSKPALFCTLHLYHLLGVM
jgi:Zn-dependent protease